MEQLTLNETVEEAITQALVRLMNKKPIAEISITELVKVAGVSRTSFYRNYESKEQVLAKHVNRIYTDFFARADIPLVLHDRREMYAFCLPRFRFIRTNKEFFVALRKSDLLNFAFDRLDHQLLLYMNGLPGCDDPYYMAGVVGSCVGILRLWIDNDFRESDEEIARRYVAQGSFWVKQ